jgi:hypothetical protein
MAFNNNFIQLLKEHTNIDTDFLDTFFKSYRIGGELDFHLKEEDVASYLEISTKTLRKRITQCTKK